MGDAHRYRAPGSRGLVDAAAACPSGRERSGHMIRYTGRGKRRSRVLPALTLAAAVAAVILLTVVAKGVVL